jgi:hypothetical protein
MSGGLSEMAKFYMRWEINPLLVPMNSEERVKLWLSMLEMVKENLSSGALTDWGMCSDSSAGYAFAETDEKSLYSSILKWFPYINFDVKPVLTVDEVIDSIKTVAKK